MRHELTIMNGSPSSRFCRTSRAACSVQMTAACSTTSFGSCVRARRGAIFPATLVPTPLATIDLFAGAGLACGTSL